MATVNMHSVVDISLQFIYGPITLGRAEYDSESQAVHNHSYHEIRRPTGTGFEISISNDLIFDVSKQGIIRAIEILGRREAWVRGQLPEGYEESRTGTARFEMPTLSRIQTQDVIHWYTDDIRARLVVSMDPVLSFDDAIRIAPNVSVLRSGARLAGVAVWNL
jgi:hypothetical protein